MKKFSFSVTLAAVLAFAGFAQAVAAEGPKAEIHFEKTVHEFGAVALNSGAAYEFEFTNTGNAPLLLSSVSSSCGCTAPNWPKTPIAPGEKGKITVEYDTKRTGAFNKSVVVHSNASTPSTALSIRGEVQP